jgi:hypothetical protein
MFACSFMFLEQRFWYRVDLWVYEEDGAVYVQISSKKWNELEIVFLYKSSILNCTYFLSNAIFEQSLLGQIRRCSWHDLGKKLFFAYQEISLSF